MDALRIDETDKTPKVEFDKATGVFSIIGRSLPENAIEFYQPLIDWVTNYLNDPNEETTLNVNLDYFNSISIKHLTAVILKFQGLKANGKIININWYFDEDDDVVRSKGELLSGMLDVSSFNQIQNTD